MPARRTKAVRGRSSRASSVRKKDSERASPSDIVLKPGIGSAHSAKQVIIFFWHIFWKGTRAGKVYIAEPKSDDEIGRRYVTVMLNKPMQGRGIGAIAFAQACKLSGLPTVYAVARRSHVASQSALKKAGFVPIERNASGEDILRWEADREPESSPTV